MSPPKRTDATIHPDRRRTTNLMGINVEMDEKKSILANGYYWWCLRKRTKWVITKVNRVHPLETMTMQTHPELLRPLSMDRCRKWERVWKPVKIQGESQTPKAIKQMFFWKKRENILQKRSNLLVNLSSLSQERKTQHDNIAFLQSRSPNFNTFLELTLAHQEQHAWRPRSKKEFP